MNKKFLVIGNDARQKEIARVLDATLCENIEDFEKNRRTEFDYVVLPTPISKVSLLEIDEEEIKRLLFHSRKVFAGGITENWETWFQKSAIAYFDLLKDEKLVEENAYITAEATVAEILKIAPFSIRGQKIIVAGYGHCGRNVANLFRKIGANVTVLARSKGARQKARADGHDATEFSYGPEECYGAGIVVNTVPEKVITEPMLRAMGTRTKIVDLASMPGGVDKDSASRYGITVLHALGLPARYSVGTGGKAFASAIQRCLAKER